MPRSIRRILAAAALCAGCHPAAAQTTDGYHSVQVFPVVVDTASFAQRFSFRNPNAVNVLVVPRYFPATGTSATPITCPTLILPAAETLTVTSLRSMCPALPAGSQFGFLHTTETNADIAPYAAFSRVANPQGNGFTVEAFAASEFTSAVSVVNGIRRMAATGGSPAFQTNCFVGNLNELAPTGTPPTTTVRYTLYNNAGVQLAAADLVLAPGQMTRLLDVFAIAPPGDYNDARVRFAVEGGVEEPGILAFCTVQDNTSFGADLRIAKQETNDIGVGHFALSKTVGPQDMTALRESDWGSDPANEFTLTYPNMYSWHIVYFRVPDVVQCEAVQAQGAQAGEAYGLEIRLRKLDGTVVAGTNDSHVFAKTYLGDKADAGGSNTPYILHVEINEHFLSSLTPQKPYRIRCRSGSGHTLGEVIRYRAAGNFY